ncbi:MAG: zinc ribbon domain-containing protein [Ruminococcaceae bacterium]|nr:zinc ribbon domain-containing protein [Oscillospiraceae bacterium]HHV32259.1 zinc ribbon domain-containing protein [Clostridiales bacterium]
MMEQFLTYEIIGSADGPISMLISEGLWFAAIICILSLLLLAGHVLIALAVYNDARSKSNRDALMWALLVGFLGLIPGIIYLCVRNNVQNYVICPQCGCSHLIQDLTCPRCGASNPYFQQSVNPLAPQQAHQAKIQLIIGLILLLVGIVGIIVSVIAFLTALLQNPMVAIH